MLAKVLTSKSKAAKSCRSIQSRPARQNGPVLKTARRCASFTEAPLPRTSDGRVWHNIGDQRSPAAMPLQNEDITIDEALGMQRAGSGDYLLPRMQGEYGERKSKNLFVITRDDMRIAPEATPFDTERGMITHTNLAPMRKVATQSAPMAVVAGELWASATTPWLWKINSGSRRFPLQDALVFNDKTLLWELPPKGTAERACLDKQWEAVAAYMLTVGAAVVMQVPLHQRFEKKLDFKIFIREDILQHEMELFMRCAPSEWKKLIKERLQQVQAGEIKPPAQGKTRTL